MPSVEESLNPLAALHVFAAYLEARARAGQERLWMSPDAYTALKEICRMKPGRMVFPKAVPPAVPVPAAAPVPVADTPDEPLPPPAPLTVTRADKEAALATVARRAEVSPKARALGTLRDIMVFATGNPDAEIMLVGEAPGAVEEQKREPFTGPAGATLDRILRAMGLDRSKVYISNICKFRPAIEGGPQGSRNRKPTSTEMESCLEYVHEEIAIIRPRVLIALGSTAAEGLLRRPVSVNRARGQWMSCQEIPLMITFHPSYILRKEEEGEEIANAEKRKLWEDMLMVMERVGMEISEKQRGYFLPKKR
ncbi:MAG TPA: uracil-DNA glycosylase [Verrucomicrobiales bacterium]|nr:uracil-DNA glycosylase [Verrucomicrobiales bacterium]